MEFMEFVFSKSVYSVHVHNFLSTFVISFVITVVYTMYTVQFTHDTVYTVQ